MANLSTIGEVQEEEEADWHVCGHETSRKMIIFSTQVLAAFSMMLVACYHISRKDDPGREMWISLLASTLGFLLPNPKL